MSNRVFRRMCSGADKRLKHAVDPQFEEEEKHSDEEQPTARCANRFDLLNLCDSFQSDQRVESYKKKSSTEVAAESAFSAVKEQHKKKRKTKKKVKSNGKYMSRKGGKNVNDIDSESDQTKESYEKKAPTEVAAESAYTGAKVKQKKKKKTIKKVKQPGKNKSRKAGNPSTEKMEKKTSDSDSTIGKMPNEPSKIQMKIDKALLNIQLNKLNPHNELCRMFGKRVVRLQNKRGRPKRYLKSTYMVTAKESWPRVTTDVFMRPTDPPEKLATESSGVTNATDELQWFTFKHSQEYQSLQSIFLEAVESVYIDSFQSILEICPYHIDTLLQLSELCKVNEDFGEANDFLERSVLALVLALHPSFSLTSGNCRLDYRRQENRPFFIVLFKYAQYLDTRACCRTALEVSKLLLSFNPDADPVAILLVIDYYALRSEEYDWFVKFYRQYDTEDRKLAHLPNMAYSYALALFKVLGECSEADEALKYALLMFPGVLCALLGYISINMKKRVQASEYFNSTSSQALQQLVCMYVCRAKAVWCRHNIFGWLDRNIEEALEQIDSQDTIISEYNQKRSVLYVTPPRSVLRHVILSDFKEEVPLAPFLSKEDSIMTFDPLPPKDSISSYDDYEDDSSDDDTENCSC